MRQTCFFAQSIDLCSFNRIIRPSSSPSPPSPVLSFLPPSPNNEYRYRKLPNIPSTSSPLNPPCNLARPRSLAATCISMPFTSFQLQRDACYRTDGRIRGDH